MGNDLQDVVLGNRYNLIEKIGEGGMALVYKARCQLLNRFVAVKILRPEFTSDEEFIKKFRRESLAAASLSHPNIVGIYDVGEQEGIYYIVMEYISGKTLKEYIKENEKINYREAINIANQIANALEHAHKNGVIHRDIKPHNILVTEDKIIKVTDFGIARASNSGTIANTGSVMGSVHYFSPEQARGGYTDHRTDIYSLGVVMYEMLTGSLPYDAESPVTVALKHIQEDFVVPTMMDSSIPEAINDIVVRSMEKDMGNRYQNIKEFIDDIEIARNNPYQKILRKESVSQMTQAIPSEEIDEALNNYNKANKSGKTKKRKKIAIILCASLLLIATLFGAAIIGYKKYFIIKDVTVPQIIGMQVADGKRTIEDLKLVFNAGVNQPNDKPNGEIIKVSPSEGMSVKEGSTISVTVSSGPEKISVPDIKNKNITDAETLLTAAKLIIGTVEHINSDSVSKDLIVSQDPAANEDASIGGAVNVFISDGPFIKTAVVPQLNGKTEAEAIAAIKAAKLKVGKITYDPNPNIIDDVVTGIGVVEGSEVPEGTAIDFTVNSTDPNSSDTPLQ